MIDDERERLVYKTVQWLKVAERAITLAGGDPSSVIDRIPSDLLHILVANDLHIHYVGKTKTKD